MKRACIIIRTAIFGCIPVKIGRMAHRGGPMFLFPYTKTSLPFSCYSCYVLDGWRCRLTEFREVRRNRSMGFHTGVTQLHIGHVRWSASCSVADDYTSQRGAPNRGCARWLFYSARFLMMPVKTRQTATGPDIADTQQHSLRSWVDDAAEILPTTSTVLQRE